MGLEPPQALPVAEEVHPHVVQLLALRHLGPVAGAQRNVNELVLRERRPGAVGVHDDVVAAQAEEELLEHGVRVRRHLVRSNGLDGADGHARHDVPGQQRAARGLRALDRLAVGRALRESPHVRARLVLGVRLEVGAVLVAQGVAEDQDVQRGARGRRERGVPAHGQTDDHLRLHRKRRAVGHHRPPSPEDEVHLVLGRGPALRVAAPVGERDQAGADSRHLADENVLHHGGGPGGRLPGLERHLHEDGRRIRREATADDGEHRQGQQEGEEQASGHGSLLYRPSRRCRTASAGAATAWRSPRRRSGSAP